MNTRLTCISALLLTCPILAQGHILTPKTGTAQEGAANVFLFGWAASQANRFMDNTHTGTRRSIDAVAFRLDYRDHNAIGRTWNKITVLAAHGDWSSIGYKSPAYKLKDTPTKVFDARWSFPALKGKPLLSPAAWGGAKNSLRFAFSTPWAYNGADAMFYEYTFSGGVADGNVPWIGPSPKGFEYYLDSMPQDRWQGGAPKTLYPSKGGKGGGGCVDSAFGSGSKRVAAYLNADLSGTTTVALELASYYTAMNSPVLYGIGLKGHAKGLDVGVGCNLLYLDFSNPVVLFPATTSSKGGYASLVLKAPRAAWMKEAWTQAAWADSKTNALKLTGATQLGFNIMPPVQYATSYTTPQFTIWTQAEKALPFARYSYK